MVQPIGYNFIMGGRGRTPWRKPTSEEPGEEPGGARWAWACCCPLELASVSERGRAGGASQFILELGVIRSRVY